MQSDAALDARTSSVVRQFNAREDAVCPVQTPDTSEHWADASDLENRKMLYTSRV